VGKWHSLLEGVSAALLTPRTETGSLAVEQFRHNLKFLLACGIRSFALNGATGEFCLTTPLQLGRLLEEMVALLGAEGQFVVGIGAPSYTASIELGRIAAQAGAKAVLLAMPYFFSYVQADLVAFVSRVADALSIPVLLYNLPQFTTGLAPETSLALIRRHENVVGIKDSSGLLDTLRLLTAEGENCCRIIGNDSALRPALRERISDGVISGVACVLPELVQQVFGAGMADPGGAEFESASRHLDALIEWLNVLPVPWGLKVIAEERRVSPATFALPVAPERQQQINLLRTWYRSHSRILCTFPPA
jgi:4-hydroxy-tetrahydrodipicolinate synthase